MIKLSLNVILEMAASFERPKSPFEKEGQEVDVYTIDTSCPPNLNDSQLMKHHTACC